MWPPGSSSTLEIVALVSLDNMGSVIGVLAKARHEGHRPGCKTRAGVMGAFVVLGLKQSVPAFGNGFRITCRRLRGHGLGNLPSSPSTHAHIILIVMSVCGLRHPLFPLDPESGQTGVLEVQPRRREWWEEDGSK